MSDDNKDDVPPPPDDDKDEAPPQPQPQNLIQQLNHEFAAAYAARFAPHRALLNQQLQEQKAYAAHRHNLHPQVLALITHRYITVAIHFENRQTFAFRFRRVHAEMRAALAIQTMDRVLQRRDEQNRVHYNLVKDIYGIIFQYLFEFFVEKVRPHYSDDSDGAHDSSSSSGSSSKDA